MLSRITRQRGETCYTLLHGLFLQVLPRHTRFVPSFSQEYRSEAVFHDTLTPGMSLRELEQRVLKKVSHSISVPLLYQCPFSPDGEPRILNDLQVRRFCAMTSLARCSACCPACSETFVHLAAAKRSIPAASVSRLTFPSPLTISGVEGRLHRAYSRLLDQCFIHDAPSSDHRVCFCRTKCKVCLTRCVVCALLICTSVPAPRVLQVLFTLPL